MKLRLAVFRVCFIVAAAVFAQTTVRAQEEIVPLHTVPGGSRKGTGTISGRVVLPSGQFLTQRVRLVVSYSTNPGVTYYTDNNGGFGFTGLGEGPYTIEATGDTRLYETVVQEVRVDRGMHVKMVIHLKERGKPADKKTENVVSVTELKQQVPDPAKKEFEKATRLVSEGRLKEAIPQYKKALVIFPEYLMARNDLGVQYLKLKRIEEAVEQFEAALEVDSKVFNPRLNLGIAMVEQKRFLEAIDHLNQAISLDSSSPSAHLYLGIASTEVDELEVADRELTAAYTLGGEQYAVVHYYKANVHMKRGEREAAIRELAAYLGKFPSGDHADNARALLEKLK